MKRVVSSSIISVVILLLVAGGFLYYQYYRGESSKAFEAVPSDVAWLISVDPSSGNLQQLARTGFFKEHDSVPVLDSWYKSLIRLDSVMVNNTVMKDIFKDSPLIISGHVTGPNSFSELFYIRLVGANPDGEADELVKALLHSTDEIQLRNYNGVDIREMTTSDRQTFSWTVSKGMFIGSFTPYLVEDAIRQQRSAKSPSPALRLLPFTEGKEKSLLVAIRYSGFYKWVSSQLNVQAGIKMDALQRVGDWSIAKMDLHPNQITFQGTTIVNDSSQFLSLFSEQKSVAIKVTSIMPSRTAAAVVWGISDPQLWLSNLESYLNRTASGPDEIKRNAGYRKYFSGWMGNEISLIVTQPVSTGNDNHYFTAISVKNEAVCKKQLSDLSATVAGSSNAEESYNGYAIRYIPVSDVLPDVFGPLFGRMNRCYYTIINGYFLASNQVSSLRGYINDIKTNNLLNTDPRFSSLVSAVPQQGSLFFYGSIPQSEKIFRSVAAPQWVSWLAKYSEKLKSWNGLVLNIASKDGVFNTNGCLGYYDDGVKGPHLVWNTKLDTTISAGPFIPVKDGDLIFAQDERLQLYALGRDGVVKWKKTLESNIKGKVNAIDMYGTGDHQYLFNTGSFIYLLDSTGANVGNYPIRLPAGASAGMSLLPLNPSVDGQFFIPCSNMRLYGYSYTGKPLDGFSTIKLQDVVQMPVWLSTLNGVSYLTINDKSGTCFFADKKGDRKFTLKEKLVDIKESAIFAPADTLSLFMFSQNGVVKVAKADGITADLFSSQQTDISSILPIDVNGDNENDFVVFTPGEIQATTADGVVIFKYKTDAGELTDASILTLQGKSLITFRGVTDNRFYLLNRNGTLYEGFPQAGISTPIVVSDSEMMFVVKSDEKSLSLYQVD